MPTSIAALLAWSAAAHAQVAVAPAANASLPPDLSFSGMIGHADWIVRGVIAGLAFASVVTWTVVLAKALELWVAGRRLGRGTGVLNTARSLDDAAARLRTVPGACAAMVDTARAELHDAGGSPAEGVKERAGWALARLQAGGGRRLGRATGVLAIIAATGPFVGLFGTVWGIMNSFIGIARAQTTNLAVVAPGIAEALLATAAGLVAAIPAVVAYNVLARATAGLRARLGDAVAQTMRLLSRDLDRRAVGQD